MRMVHLVLQHGLGKKGDHTNFLGYQMPNGDLASNKKTTQTKYCAEDLVVLAAMLFKSYAIEHKEQDNQKSFLIVNYMQ